MLLYSKSHAINHYNELPLTHAASSKGEHSVHVKMFLKQPSKNQSVPSFPQSLKNLEEPLAGCLLCSPKHWSFLSSRANSSIFNSVPTSRSPAWQMSYVNN